MTARGAMRHRATLERPVHAGGKDPYGATAVLERATSEIPCYWWERSITEAEDGRKVTRISVGTMIVPLGTAIAEGDRVVAVNDRRGRSIVTSRWDVTGILTQPDHLEVLLEVTR